MDGKFRDTIHCSECGTELLKLNYDIENLVLSKTTKILDEIMGVTNMEDVLEKGQKKYLKGNIENWKNLTENLPSGNYKAIEISARHAKTTLIDLIRKQIEEIILKIDHIVTDFL